MPAAELITQAEYARRRQVDPTSVRDAIRAGRITLIEGKIDPVVADIQWQTNSRARIKAPPRQQALADAPADSAAHAPAARPAAPAGGLGGIGGESDYWASRAARERAEASIAELKLAEMQRTLVRQDDVQREVGKLAAEMRDAVMQIDARLAPLVAIEGDVAKCQELIRAELRAVLEVLAKSATGAAPVTEAA